MSKLAKVTISENSTVIEMMLRIIGSVMNQIRCHQLHPSIAGGFIKLLRHGFERGQIQDQEERRTVPVLTRITEKRAQYASPVHGTVRYRNAANIQLKAL